MLFLFVLSNRHMSAYAYTHAHSCHSITCIFKLFVIQTPIHSPHHSLSLPSFRLSADSASTMLSPVQVIQPLLTTAVPYYDSSSPATRPTLIYVPTTASPSSAVPALNFAPVTSFASTYALSPQAPTLRTEPTLPSPSADVVPQQGVISYFTPVAPPLISADHHMYDDTKQKYPIHNDVELKVA